MSSGPELVLDARQLMRSFGDVQALRGLDLEMHAGEVVGLLGPNGAGKTTLVRILATLIQPDAGVVTICGIDAAREPATVRAHLGLAGQFASVDEMLTARENLELVGRLYGLAGDECRHRADGLLATLALSDVADRRVGTYSGGMRRRLDLGATLIGEPALLLLDEPTTGLDPWSRHELWDLIEAIAARGTAVLVTSQNLDEVERLADRVVVIDDGRVVADDHPRSLASRMGGRVIDVQLDRGRSDGRATLSAAAEALASAGLEPHADTSQHRLTATTNDSLRAAARAAQELIDADVEPSAFALR